MLTTIEGVYENGKVELAEQPAGIEKARVLVTFLKETTPALSGRMKVDANSFLEFVRTLEGETLYTKARSVPFVVQVIGDVIYYTPLSSQRPRPHKREYTERMLERFAEINSLRPMDYHDLTVNASYTLTLLDLYLDAAGRK